MMGAGDPSARVKRSDPECVKKATSGVTVHTPRRLPGN